MISKCRGGEGDVNKGLPRGKGIGKGKGDREGGGEGGRGVVERWWQVVWWRGGGRWCDGANAIIQW